MQRESLLLFAFLALSVLVSPVQGADYTWSGAEDSNWNNPNNWVSGTVPGAGCW